MRILITAGPTLSPLDAVRHIANRSSGTLATTLAQLAHDAGHHVLLLRSVLCTCPPPQGIDLLPFDTHRSLLQTLQDCATQERIHALWHAAAVGDFIVEKITTTENQPSPPQSHDLKPPTTAPARPSDTDNATAAAPLPGKLDSRSGPLHITLALAPKILPLLPDLFPAATIVGWKYEVDGSRHDVIQKGLRQLRQCRTAACVLNGPAWGEGWALLRPDASCQAASTHQELFTLLAQVSGSEHRGVAGKLCPPKCEA